MMLKDRNGEEKIRHEEMANIIWEAYKERLGTSKFSQMHFNLSDLMNL
jgi:RNase P/RNase MRP subunit POP5